ncbi:MAG: efflux RND transporter periplasmic adaptor subunit [Deltaproteobacteria bacterium]|nr:efflux RND transporter periplasmic adaptor subunit [Deltaproteobacteria bacterium]
MSTPSPQPDKPPRSALLYVMGLIVSVAAVLGVVLLSSRRSAAEAREADARKATVAAGPLVRTAQVQVSRPAHTVVLAGDVRAFQQATLYAKVSGYLKDIHVDKGDNVKANQLLATLESPEIEQAYNAAEADLNNKRAQSNRFRDLAKKGVASEQDAENAEAATKVAEANLRSVAASRGYQEIRAPFTGVITSRFVDPGALVSAGANATQSAQPVVDIAQMDTLRIYIYLGQDDAAFVREGDTAVITEDARPSVQITDKVARISRNLDPRTRTMLCEVDVDNHGGLLFPGDFVHVKLSLMSEPFPLVPSAAIIARTGKLMVAVVRDGHAHLVPVTVGRDDGTTAQITSGLLGGETVALGVAAEVQDGMPVRVAQPTAAAN